MYRLIYWYINTCNFKWEQKNLVHGTFKFGKTFMARTSSPMTCAKIVKLIRVYDSRKYICITNVEKVYKI